MSGKREKMPATLARTNVRKYACRSAASRLGTRERVSMKNVNYAVVPHLRGTKTSKTAFSWTCQPNRKDVYPQSVSAVKKDLYVGVNQSFRSQICGSVTSVAIPSHKRIHLPIEMQS